MSILGNLDEELTSIALGISRQDAAELIHVLRYKNPALTIYPLKLFDGCIVYGVRGRDTNKLRTFIVHHTDSDRSFVIASNPTKPSEHNLVAHLKKIDESRARLNMLGFKITDLKPLVVDAPVVVPTTAPIATVTPKTLPIFSDTARPSRGTIEKFLLSLSSAHKHRSESVEQIIINNFQYIMSKEKFLGYFKRTGSQLYFCYRFGMSQFNEVLISEALTSSVASYYLNLLSNHCQQPPHNQTFLNMLAMSIATLPTTVIELMLFMGETPLTLDQDGVNKYFEDALDLLVENKNFIDKQDIFTIYHILRSNNLLSKLKPKYCIKLINFIVEENHHNTVTLEDEDWEQLCSLLAATKHPQTIEHFLVSLTAPQKMVSAMAHLQGSEYFLVRVKSLCLNRMNEIHFSEVINALHQEFCTFNEDDKLFYIEAMQPHFSILATTRFKSELREEPKAELPKKQKPHANKTRAEKSDELFVKGILKCLTHKLAAPYRTKAQSELTKALTNQGMLYLDTEKGRSYAKSIAENFMYYVHYLDTASVTRLHEIIVRTDATLEQTMKSMTNYALVMATLHGDITRTKRALHFGADPNFVHHLIISPGGGVEIGDEASQISSFELALDCNLRITDNVRLVLINEMILYGADISALGFMSQAPIFRSLLLQNPVFLQSLIASGVNLNRLYEGKDRIAYTILDIAHGMGVKDKVEILQNAGAQYHYGAVRCTHIIGFDTRVLTELFDASAIMLSENDAFHETAQYKALSSNSSFSLSAHRGADVRYPTLLHLMAASSNLTAVNFLLNEHHANPHLYNKLSWILTGTIREGHISSIKFEPLYGRNPDSLQTGINTNFFTLLFREMSCPIDCVNDLRKDWLIARALLDHTDKVDLDRRNARGETILERAMQCVAFYAVSDLVNTYKCAFKDAIKKATNPSIKIFLFTHQIYTAEKFIINDISPNGTKPSLLFSKSELLSNKPLIDAIEKNDIDAIVDFLDSVSNPSEFINLVTLGTGLSALHFACLKQRYTIIELLVTKYSARVSDGNPTPINLFYISHFGNQAPPEDTHPEQRALHQLTYDCLCAKAKLEIGLQEDESLELDEKGNILEKTHNTCLALT